MIIFSFPKKKNVFNTFHKMSWFFVITGTLNAAGTIHQ